RYDEWNPYTRIEGEAIEGTTLRVAPGPKAGRMPTFRPRVRSAIPNQELRWLGHLYVRGLFDGEHRFRIESLGDDRSRLTQEETFSGILVGPITRRYGEQTESNFRGVNEAIKERAESMSMGIGETSTGADGSEPTAA
ncbi:MAG: hypothetical protein ACI9EZ_001266, partial [Halobacteriales archaeon]